LVCGLWCVSIQVADPDKFKLLYKDLVISSRTKDKGCVQYDLLQSTKDPVLTPPAPLHLMHISSSIPCAGTLYCSTFPASHACIPQKQFRMTGVKATYGPRRRVLLQPQKQFRMIEAWATQKDLDVHGGGTPWMTEKRKKQESPEFKDCLPASVNVDLSYVNVF
jgi:quinol monooxygenase YgiN